MKNIKSAFLNPSEIYVNTGVDGLKYATDRYAVWRVVDLPAKIAEVFSWLPHDGVWDIKAGGGFTPAKNQEYADELPNVDRLLTYPMLTAGTELEPTPIYSDHTSSKSLYRFWTAEGYAYGVDARFDLTGYALHLNGTSRDSVKLPVVRHSPSHGTVSEVVGAVMAVRFSKPALSEVLGTLHKAMSGE